MASPIPIIATGPVYATYLNAIRTNMDALLRLTQDLRDDEAETEAQRILDCYDDAAVDLLAMIEEANAPQPSEWWRAA